MLTRKYNEKKVIAAFSEKKGYYNNAVSAYYYNILLRLKHYLLNNGIKIDTSSSSSHEQIIQSIIDHSFKLVGNNIITFADYSYLNNNLRDLKKCRVKADYSDQYEFDNNKYQNEFKLYYDLINNVLTKMGI